MSNDDMMSLFRCGISVNIEPGKAFGVVLQLPKEEKGEAKAALILPHEVDRYYKVFRNLRNVLAFDREENRNAKTR